MPPRPQDPAVLYHALTTHQANCAGCANGGQCPYGEHLLEAWGDSERFYAAEQAVIDAVRSHPDSESKEESTHA